MILSEKTSAWESGDTVIYGFNKMVRLLLECNPNACEMLGMEKEQYLIVSPLGRELLARQNIFLSKKAIRSFGGYAQAHLAASGFILTSLSIQSWIRRFL